MQVLLKLEEFDQATRDGCFVGVFDSSTPSHLHVFPCSRVGRRHFYEKVVTNGGKNGRYVRYDDLKEALAGIGDKPCSTCFPGVRSLLELSQTPTIKAALEARARFQQAAELRPQSVPAIHDGTRRVAAGPSRTVLVRWADAAKRTLEGWCSRQLDLESKPPDPRGELRLQLKPRLREMRASDADVLVVRYTAQRLLPNSDAENVLLTNIDATCGVFSHLARSGVHFEFVPEDPAQGANAPGLTCRSTYELVASPKVATRWAEGEELAKWDWTPTPSLPTTTSSPSVWWDLRRGLLTTLSPGDRPQHFGVHMRLGIPKGLEVNLAAKIKVVMDAAVLALCCEDGTTTPEGLAAFAAAVGREIDEVKSLMLDRTKAVLGSCRMADRMGRAQPPDAGCVRGSLTVEHSDTTIWRLSGRVVELLASGRNSPRL